MLTNLPQLNIHISSCKAFHLFQHKNLLSLFYILVFHNTSYFIIYFTLHYIKISKFLDFFNCSSFFTYNNHHPLSFFTFRIHNERIKNYMQNEQFGINLHNYYDNFANLHIFNLTLWVILMVKCVKKKTIFTSIINMEQIVLMMQGLQGPQPSFEFHATK